MGKKILAIDNHPIILKFLEKILQGEGHEILTAKDGLSALDILEEFTPDIFFIDLIMPNIGGKKLCQIVRKMPSLNGAYIIILSAIAAEEEINLAEFGADACIAKGPFDEMKSLVLEAVERAGRGPAARSEEKILGVEKVHSRAITRELLEIKKHFEVILEKMSEGILEISTKGRIVYANPEALSLIGLPEEKLLGSRLIDHFCESDRGRVSILLGSMQEALNTISGTSPFRLKEKLVSISATPLGDEEKRTILIINDVTERQRIEKQLLQAQKMEAVGILAGGIAHDFNNLLMAIQGNVSLLSYTMDPSHPDYERLKNIEKQVERGAGLTNQLLGYARKGRYEVIPVDVNQLIQEISESFERKRKEITIHRDLAKDLLPIEADQGQIEQVLSNLFTNAADAMPEGGDLYLKTSNISHQDMRDKLYEPRPGQYVQLLVRDSGLGMDEETLERIFEPFFTTKDMGKGVGLGLAAVYGIVKGHAGYIEVESEKGRGTSFKIYLPTIRTEDLEKRKASKRETELKKEMILLVDDEEMIRDIAKELLNALGYPVYCAPNGEKAIEVYSQHRDEIALVLLDMIMPSMNGGEAFNRLKEINPDIKVLLSSGFSIDGEATHILERGCDGFIQKPFSMKTLNQKIREILDQGKG